MVVIIWCKKGIIPARYNTLERVFYDLFSSGTDFTGAEDKIGAGLIRIVCSAKNLLVSQLSPSQQGIALVLQTGH
jgi:hypothetical protein